MFTNKMKKSEKLILLCLALSFFCFYISLVDIVFSKSILKAIFISLKYIFMTAALLICISKGIPKKVVLFTLIVLMFALITLDKIMLEIVFSVLLASVCLNTAMSVESKYIFIKVLLKLSLFFFITVVLLSYVGILPEKIYDNPFADGSVSIMAESKNTLGFWNPNVTSAIISASLLISFMISHKKLYALSILLYCITFPVLLSKAYFLVVLTTIFLSFLSYIKFYTLIRIGAFFSIITSFLVFIFSYLLVFPALVKKSLSVSNFNLLDLITSFRISIAEKATSDIGGVELITGFWLPKDYIDSGLANINFSIGVFLASLLFLLYLFAMCKNYIYGNYKVVYLLMFFVVINFFESLIYFNSLFFLFITYIYLNSFKKNKLAVLNALTKQSSFCRKYEKFN